MLKLVKDTPKDTKSKQDAFMLDLLYWRERYSVRVELKSTERTPTIHPSKEW
jgi:hypothetical protein